MAKSQRSVPACGVTDLPPFAARFPAGGWTNFRAFAVSRPDSLLAPEERGATLEELRKAYPRNPLSPTVLFRDRTFPTPTGRIQLITSVEPTPLQLPDDRQLSLLAVSTDKAQALHWVHGEDQGPITATVHPDAARGFFRRRTGSTGIGDWRNDRSIEV